MGRDKTCMLANHNDIPDSIQWPNRNATKDVHRYISKSIRDVLIRDGVLLPDSSRPKKCVCETCLHHILETYCNVEEENVRTSSSSDDSDVEMQDVAEPAGDVPISADVQSVIDKLSTGALTSEEKTLLATALGNSIKDEIKEDIIRFGENVSSYEYLNQLDFIEYLNGCSKPLVSFLKSCTHSSRRLKAGSIQQLNNYICKAVEAVYGARNLKFIAPYSYMENLLVYYSSQSKLASDIYGSACPGGVYKTIKRQVRKQVADKPLQCPDGDIVIAFDNNQVLSRNWKIHVDAKMPTSCITSLCVMKILTENFQIDPAFSPSNWNYPPPDQAEAKFDEYLQKDSLILNQFRDDFFVQQIEYFKSLSASSVTNVRVILNSSAINGDIRGLVEVTDLEPLNVNPNSEERVRDVLFNIKQQAGIPSRRKWVVVVCDGLPYIMADQVIKRTTSCNVCEAVLFTEEDARTHMEQEHHLANANLMDVITRPLECIHLKPGNGHIEMNFIRSIFRLLWDPCLSEFTSLLGFRSQKAQQFVMADKDHHICWQILQTLFDALTAEIFSLFLKENQDADAEGFVIWISQIKNKTIKFYADVSFSLLFPVLLFRAGIRRGDYNVALAGRDKASVIFFIGHHPKYQQLVVRDLHRRISYPTAVPFVSSAESFSESKDGAMQGADFVMEQQVRKTHRWLPPGVPTFDHWIQSVRNVQPLEKLLQINMDRLNISQSKFSEYVKKTDTTEATNGFRKLLQEKGVFENSSMVTPWISSLSGLQLHESLEYFLTIANNNMKEAFVAFCNNTQPQYKKVFIKVSDATGNADKMTKEQLISVIKLLIGRTTPNKAEAYNAKLSACKLKPALVNLYADMLQNCTFVPTEEDEDEGGD